MANLYDGRIHGGASPETTGACNPQWAVSATAKKTTVTDTGVRLAVSGPSNATKVAHTSIQPSYHAESVIATAAEPLYKKSIATQVSGGVMSVTNLYDQLTAAERAMYIRDVEIVFPVSPLVLSGASPSVDLIANGPRPHQGLGYRLIRGISVQNGGCGVDIQASSQLANFGAGDMLLMDARSGAPDDHSVEQSALQRGGFYEGTGPNSGNMHPLLRGMLFHARDLRVRIRRLLGGVDLIGGELSGVGFSMTYDTNLMNYIIWEGAYAGVTEANAAGAPFFITALPALGNPRLEITFTNAIPKASRIMDNQFAVPESIVRDSWNAGDQSQRSIPLSSTTNTISAIAILRLTPNHGDPLGPQRDFNPHLVEVLSSASGASHQSFRATLSLSGVLRAELVGDVDDWHRLSRAHAVEPAQNIGRLGIQPYADHGDENHEHATLASPIIGPLQSGTGTDFTIQPMATAYGGQTGVIPPYPSFFIAMPLKLMQFSLGSGAWLATAAKIF